MPNNFTGLRTNVPGWLRLDWTRIYRNPLRALSWRRLVRGGRLSDLGRLPRYIAFFLIGLSCFWAPIVGYLATAPVKYASRASLILPGSGVSSSVNLTGIGQASSFANSAFSNGSISPTETYKRLLAADRILDAAAKAVGLHRSVFGKPRVTLVDQTSLIHIETVGPTPNDAQRFGDALVAAFFTEIDALRSDEIATREASGTAAIQDYTKSIGKTRAAIAELQRSSGLISVEQYREQVTTSDEARQSLRSAQGELARQSERVAALEAALDLPPDAAAATLKLYADAEYLSLLDDVSAGAAGLSQAGASYGARHPTYLTAHDAYDSARQDALARASEVTGLPIEQLQGLDRAPEGQRAQLLSELVRQNAMHSGLVHHVDTLLQQVNDEVARLAALAPIAAELEDRQRDFAVAEAVFASAIARSESKKTDVFASYPLVQVLEDPSLPEKPSSPRRKLSYLAGIAASLMLLIGLVLTWIRKPLISRLLNDPADPAP